VITSKEELPAICLIPAQPKHAEEWLAMRCEPTAARFNPLDDLDLDGVRVRLGEVGVDLTDQSKPSYRWMIQCRADVSGDSSDCETLIVGTVSLSTNWKMRHGEIGYHLFESHFGRGIGTRAVRMLVEMAFAPSSELNRLVAFIAEQNTASRKLIERVGFTHEGTMREHYRIGDQFVTEAVYGLLRSDWVANDCVCESGRG